MSVSNSLTRALSCSFDLTPRARLADEIQEWLESFGLGYKRDDPSTIREECLPIIHQKGLVQAYGAPHEVGPNLLNPLHFIDS